MAGFVAVLASLAFIVWFIFWAVREKSLKAHSVSFGVAVVAAILTYSYFLSMELPQFLKIIASIILGVVLIIIGGLYARRVAERS
jgi:multisubunit Na+/H+ antiporter MnhE subunit